MRRFAQNAPLPPGYGTRLDERVVEYPWVLARLGPDAHDLLDAGSTLNWPYLLDHPLLREKRIALLTLAPELWYLPDHRLSYLFGDLRETRLRSGAFDAVTCISTLEHIGMDNSRYTGMADRAGGLHAALDELRRVIRPGGTLLLTVPYGQPADLGWQQVFGPSALADILDRLGGMVRDQAIYCYSADGWQIADEDGCAGAVYHDFLAERRPPPDGAAAARAVACVQIQY
ncbi:MAG: class I SAM-dependent methyltransferase [Chloroflexi bacterium]|nr:class I SAM-dependent methyltransferase [Chloroflexota bacterium]